MALHERLQDVFRDVFDDPGLVLTDTTTAADIPDWDSLQHVTLLFRIEDDIYMKHLNTIYRLGFSNDFKQFEKVSDPNVQARLNK